MAFVNFNYPPLEGCSGSLRRRLFAEQTVATLRMLKLGCVRQRNARFEITLLCGCVDVMGLFFRRYCYCFIKKYVRRVNRRDADVYMKCFFVSLMGKLWV